MRYAALMLVLFAASPAYGTRSLTVRMHRDHKLIRCMVYLPAMRDVRLRRWCLKQSERMP